MPIVNRQSSDASVKSQSGFTLIELLIVIGVLGILAGIILVAVDPAKRLGQSRDARRHSEVNAILNAILNYTVDNRGKLPSALQSATDTHMIGTCASGAGFEDACPGNTPVATCADLSELVDEYIAEIPVDPLGSHADPNNATTYDDAMTGYYVKKTTGGRIEIGSCNPEQVPAISVKR